MYKTKYFIQLYQKCSIINRQLFVPWDELGPENINACSYYTTYEYYTPFQANIYKTEIGLVRTSTKIHIIFFLFHVELAQWELNRFRKNVIRVVKNVYASFYFTENYVDNSILCQIYNILIVVVILTQVIILMSIYVCWLFKNWSHRIVIV